MTDDKLERAQREIEEGGDRAAAEELDDRLPSKAAAVHEVIRHAGERELRREVMALLWSAIAAGITMSTSLMGRGMLQAYLPDSGIGFLLEAAGYTVGFILVIAAGQQLFTENTVTPVLPFMDAPTRANLGKLLRLWTTVLAGNTIGAAIAAAVFAFLPIFTPEVDAAFVNIGTHLMENSAREMFAKGIVAGWLIATMVWAVYAFEAAKFVLIFMVTWLIGIGDFTHIAVGSIEVIYLMLLGQTTWEPALFHFALPTLLGNVIGGTFIFALISHAEVKADVDLGSRSRAD